MSSTIRPLLLLSLLPLGAAPLGAAAQSATDEPRLVLARTVHPRIAYRALARTDNPVMVQAPLFPATAFSGAVEDIGAQNVDDAVLAALGAGGLIAPHGEDTGAMPVNVFGPATLSGGHLGGSGGAAGAGGAVGRATSGIAGTVTQAVSQVLGVGGPP